jgi:hypothetical protein
MPRQQLLDMSNGVVGDACHYFSQVRFRIKYQVLGIIRGPVRSIVICPKNLYVDEVWQLLTARNPVSQEQRVAVRLAAVDAVHRASQAPPHLRTRHYE